jgi:hypothetical protein
MFYLVLKPLLLIIFLIWKQPDLLEQIFLFWWISKTCTTKVFALYSLSRSCVSWFSNICSFSVFCFIGEKPLQNYPSRNLAHLINIKCPSRNASNHIECTSVPYDFNKRFRKFDGHTFNDFVKFLSMADSYFFYLIKYWNWILKVWKFCHLLWWIKVWSKYYWLFF